jgi:hypothetical protein
MSSDVLQEGSYTGDNGSTNLFRVASKYLREQRREACFAKFFPGCVHSFHESIGVKHHYIPRLNFGTTLRVGSG